MNICSNYLIIKLSNKYTQLIENFSDGWELKEPNWKLTIILSSLSANTYFVSIKELKG